MSWLVVSTYPSEKYESQYEFVSWDDGIPNIEQFPNHQPAIVSGIISHYNPYNPKHQPVLYIYINPITSPPRSSGSLIPMKTLI